MFAFAGNSVPAYCRRVLCLLEIPPALDELSLIWKDRSSCCWWWPSSSSPDSLIGEAASVAAEAAVATVNRTGFVGDRSMAVPRPRGRSWRESAE